MKLVAGTYIADFEILSRLGKGGMGEGYLAKDAHLHGEVAIQVLPADFATNVDRLSRNRSAA